MNNINTVNTDAPESMPHISVNAQYIKDLSFENPKAPSSLAALSSHPQLDLTLDIDIQKLHEENFYEVELTIKAAANNEKFATLFLVELKYAGVFNLINIPLDQHQMILSIHCPAMIFPFARKIIASVTQDGGFQPLMIDPIDFGALYHKKMMEHQN